MAVDTTGQSVARLREYHEHRAGDLCFLRYLRSTATVGLMKPEESYSVLRAFLKERRRTLNSLDVVSATAFAFEFYRNIRAEGTSPLMGDGMAWNCDIIRRSNGSPYEFSLVRLFATDDRAPGLHGARLRLSLQYAWTDVAQWNGYRAGSSLSFGGTLAWNVESADKLFESLKSGDGYKTLVNRQPRAVQLRYESRWDPTG